MDKQKKKQKGITLIALVISIIVMLILAGVSLNMTVGDNGIISQAQQATFMQSCAVLEEFINEQGVQDYVDEEYEGTAFIDLLRLKHSDWIYKNEKTGIPFLLVNGKIYYLIQKENLPDQIRNQIRGGDAGNKTYDDYVNFRDVYGVTSDLKVYYCSDGLDTRVGAADELLEDSATRVALKSNSSSGLADYLADTFDWVKTDGDGNVLAENLSSLKSLTIDSNNVKNLKELYNLSSLTTLTLKNASLTTLEGVDLAPNLKSIFIENSTCGNYTSLSSCSGLTKLYLTKVNQSEATGVLTALASMSSSKLEYFGIYESPNVTDMSKMDNISSAVKNSIKYLYLYNDKYTTIGFTGFNKLYELHIEQRTVVDTNAKTKASDNAANSWDLVTVTSLTCPALEYLYAYGNFGLKTISNVNCPKLYYMHMQHNHSLESLADFSESTVLRYIYLYKCYPINSLSFLANNSRTDTVEALQFEYCDVTTLGEISDSCANNLRYIYANSSSLGKGCDTNYNSTTRAYDALGKSNSNALVKLKNNTKLYYVGLQNCPYLKYVSYLKNAGIPATTSVPKPISEFWLHGSTNNILESELTEIKPFINKCVRYALPNNLTLALVDESTTAVRIQDTTITDSSFRTLKNKTNIKQFLFGQVTVKNATTGAVLTTAEMNSLFNEVLSTCTGITNLYLYTNISDISFVKNMNNLQEVMLQKYQTTISNCQVGTKYTDASGNKYHQDAAGNPTGLELFNTYCPNLKALRIWDYTNDAAHQVDLSLIQPAINKMNTWAWPDNRINDNIGLWLNNQWIADSMAKCTNITNFISYHLYNITYDLSNCKSLKDVRVRAWDGNWNEIATGTYRGHIKLPTTYVVPSGDTNPGYYLYMEYSADDTIISGGTGCRELYMNYVRGINTNGDGDDTKFANQFTGLNNSYLKKIQIRTEEVYANFISSNFLTKLATCTSLQELYYYGYSDHLGKFSSIAPISTMTGLTKVYINNTAVSKIPDISSLTNLTYMYIQNSNIVDISGLYKNEQTALPLRELYLNGNSINNMAYLRNLHSLVSLDLRNNSITNSALSSLFGTVDNISELNSLKSKYNQLANLWVRSGNKFDSVAGLEWAKD